MSVRAREGQHECEMRTRQRMTLQNPSQANTERQTRLTSQAMGGHAKKGLSHGCQLQCISAQRTGVLLLGSASHRIASHLVQAVDAREHSLKVFHHAWQHTVHRKLDLALSVYCGRNQNAFLTARRHGGGESKLGVRLLAVPSALSFLPTESFPGSRSQLFTCVQ